MLVNKINFINDSNGELIDSIEFSEPRNYTTNEILNLLSSKGILAHDIDYINLHYTSNYRKLAKIAYKISQLPPNYTLNSLESAIYWHRKMWNFIADTIINEKIIPSKLDFIVSTIHTRIRYNCFLCAYALIKQDDPYKSRCECCPVKWPNDLNCNSSENNLYIKFKSYSELALYEKEREKYLAQAYLCAKFIAKLPIKDWHSYLILI